MIAHAHRAATILGLLVCLPTLVMAQPPTRPASSTATAAAPMCSPRAMAITIPIVDDVSGSALREGDITVRVAHRATGRRLKDANELPMDPPGRWVLFTQGDITVSNNADESIIVEVVRAGATRVRRELKVGLDSTKCQTRLIDAPAAIRVP
jgi:hypothetical protein